MARGSFFEGQQNHMENKSEGNKNKIILGDFNCTMIVLWIKWTGILDVVPIIPCQNLLWILG